MTIGTDMSPLGNWHGAMHIMTASKKGVSSHQLIRMIGVTYVAAWLLAHRFREATKPRVNELS